MSRTGLEDAYIMRGSKKLRMGYTTGSCAAAAARGAAFMLLSGKEIQEVKIHTPKGIVLNPELLQYNSVCKGCLLPGKYVLSSSSADDEYR